MAAGRQEIHFFCEPSYGDCLAHGEAVIHADIETSGV
jgi:hypothetical protein